MARVPRKLTVVAGHSVHKIWRGHNKEWNLAGDENKAKYLAFLNEDIESEKYDVGARLEALCLMDSHTHEVNGIEKPKEFSNHMRRHHSKYGRYFNKKNKRCGKVALDRPKTCLLDSEQYELQTVLYIHANPLRAKMVTEAREYHWSTHNLYAFGKRAEWMKHISFPSWYLKLGVTMERRQREYRKLFAKYLRTSGLIKQPFLYQNFYGPTIWMMEKEASLSLWRKSHAPP